MGGDLCRGNQQEILDLKVGADENLYEARYFHLYPQALATRNKIKFQESFIKIDRTQYTEFKQEGTYIGKVCKIKHGLGIMIYENEGFYYIGQWINNNRQGLGFMLYKDGSYYQGQWYQNKPHGYGEYNNPDNNWVYRGKWKAGKKNGIGQQTYPDGTVYKGNYTDDLKQGDGVFIFNTEIQIDSTDTQKNSKIQKVTEPQQNTTNSKVTDPQLSIINQKGAELQQVSTNQKVADQNSKIQQENKVVNVAKKCTFKGKFEKDMATKFGVQRGQNYLYQGLFLENDFHGPGKTTYFEKDAKSYDVYIGQFKKGLKHGYGEYRWSDGRIYKGQWQQGQIISRGVFIDKRT